MVEHLPAPSDLILYRTEDGRTRIEVRLADETVWMTQAAMAELYQTTPAEYYPSSEIHFRRRRAVGIGNL